ncbi:MAG: acyltransferase domain-containing protein [Deltaproteobacteria bacterium]|nr:acyltransferase domain-containing protein [Deltaproteobacteria bacterium]
MNASGDGTGDDGSSSVDRRVLLERIAARRATLRTAAVVGLDCRFPGAPDPQALWTVLRDGVDTIAEIPATRWDVDTLYDPNFERPGTVSTRFAGLLPAVDQWDADFFGVSPREAATLDPQHRLLLTTVWHAIEDAGLSRQALAGTRTGVYVALYQRDYTQLAMADPLAIDAYTASGTHHGIAANRVSYALDLQGPSMVVDTACSSSLVATHLALRALRAREIDRAIVAAVNLLLGPEETMALSRWGMMAADGRCKAFDARADGFVRAEGAAALVLERMEDAVASGRRVRAQLLGSAVNQDGRSNGLTAPNGLAQQRVLRQALHDAKLQPAQISMIEAHGTGTALGDPIEIEALDAVYGAGSEPCAIGSIKTNVGHLEAAAGMAGMLKAIACIEHQRWVPSLHLRELNPAIDLDQSRMFVTTDGAAWTGSRIAGVSSFGMGGTNAHVLLGPAPQAPADRPATVPGRAHILPISAHDPQALRQLVSRWAAWLRDEPNASVGEGCASAAVHRSHLSHRVAVVGHSGEELVAGLDDWSSTPAAPPVSGRPRGPVFVFPGQGSQWMGMGRALAAAEPAFSEALDSCDAEIRAQTGWSVCDALHSEAPQLHRIDVVQPLLLSLAVAMASLWRSLGVEPAVVVGHSMGEVAAAHVAGILALPDAVRIIVERSRRMLRLRGTGTMRLAFASAERLAESRPASIAIAAINGPSTTVLSGPVQALDDWARVLEAQGVEMRAIDVDVASHHPTMDELRPQLLDVLAGSSPGPGDVPLWSTVTARPVEGPQLDAAYWVRNLRDPVRLWPVVEQLLAQGYRDFVEISPHPVLLPSIEQGVTALSIDDAALVPSTRRNSDQGDEHHQWLQAVARVYARGHAVNWNAVVRGPTPVRSLPRYPFSERRHWLPSRRGAADNTSSRPPVEDDVEGWTYALQWEARPLVAPQPSRAVRVIGHGALANAVVDALARQGTEVSRSPSLDALDDAWVGAEALIDLSFTTVSNSADLPDAAVAHGDLLRRLEPTQVQPWLVTRAGAPSLPHRDPVQAALWGLARVTQVEHEPLRPQVIDLDPQGSVHAAADALARAVCSADGHEPVVALRGETRLGLRLRPTPLATAPPLQLRPDATYVVASGLGGLGREVGRWLVECGARHLLVLGRTSLPERQAWGEIDDPRVAVVRQLEACGAAVYPVACDIADADALGRLASTWSSEGRPSIRGIVHAAGIQHVGPVVELDAHPLSQQLAAKVRGSEMLAQVFGSLDFLVLFSSAASMFRSPLLGGYVMASAYQDALAERLRAAGSPVTTIGWGPWVAGGMAERFVASQGRGLEGFVPMAPRSALAVLERALHHRVPHVGAMHIDWPTWSQRHPGEATQPLVRSLADDSSAPEPVQTSSADGVVPSPAQLAAQDLQTRTQTLGAYLRWRLGRILRCAPARIDTSRAPTSLGLDSLMAVELRNRVAADLGLRPTIVSILRSETIDALITAWATRIEHDSRDEQQWDELTI